MQPNEGHWGGLHDQNEDAAGTKINEATGKPIDNSTATTEKLDRLAVRSVGKTSRGEDMLGDVNDNPEYRGLDDVAKKWLQENGETVEKRKRK